VDVCGLIKQCRDDIRRQWDCEPAWPHTDPECRELSEPWVLYLCYDEKPSRGITALRGSSGTACCSRCSNSVSAHCGCGCHAKTSGTTQTAYRPSARITALQCEPTVTCEGYTFQIRKAPRTTSQGDLGAMINRISACIRDLVPLSQELQRIQEGSLNAVKAKLRTFLDEHAIQNCELYQKIQDLSPEPVGILHPLLVEFLQECLCSALLPPCPEPVEDNCVPLATVTVNCKDGCRIERVCNWEQRRVVITVPNLEYWFAALLRQSGLTKFLTELCCRLSEQESTPRNFLSTLLSNAVTNPGQITSPSVYQQLGVILREFLSKFSVNP
jgi:hypothetical protein